ncbi:MAG: hypothetical protein R3261_14210 [Alphaproteobacteria bacterium]|nr:hypothetical protein [Alphaproteobacteria bacterium]
MYSIFDTFIDIDTWHTDHPDDLIRFYRALAFVVDQQEFCPQTMGNYIRDKIPTTENTRALYDHAVEKLIHRAEAVKTYIAATRL